MFTDFQFVVYFAPLLYKFGRKIIFSKNLIIFLWKKRRFRRFRDSRPCLLIACGLESRHSRKRVFFHRETFKSFKKIIIGFHNLRPWINQITWSNSFKSSCKITFLFKKIHLPENLGNTTEYDRERLSTSFK